MVESAPTVAADIPAAGYLPCIPRPIVTPTLMNLRNVSLGSSFKFGGLTRHRIRASDVSDITAFLARRSRESTEQGKADYTNE